MLLFALAGWVFWPVLIELNERWLTDPHYSHCAIVPLAALFVFWARRHSIPSPRRSAWLGLIIVGVGLGLNYFGEITFFGFVQAFGFIFVLLGIVASLHGWRTAAWALPPMFLLAFAIPLPYRIHTALAEPLQRAVAFGVTNLLQLRGRPAISMGHVVAVDDHRVSVVDACCGLGMLFVFVFVAATIAVLSRRPVIDRILLCLVAPIVGLLANILRVSVTLEARLLGYSDDVVTTVHDVGGYLLAPVALAALLMFLLTVAIVFPNSKPADEPLQIAFQLGVSDGHDQVAPVRRRSPGPSSAR